MHYFFGVNLKLIFRLPYSLQNFSQTPKSHSQHLVRNGVHKLIFFDNIFGVNLKLIFRPPYSLQNFSQTLKSHSQHLVRNGVHKLNFLDNISLRSLFTNYF